MHVLLKPAPKKDSNTPSAMLAMYIEKDNK